MANILQIATARKVYPPTTGGHQRIHGIVSSFPCQGYNVKRVCHSGPFAEMYRSGKPVISTSKEYLEKNYEEIVRHSVINDVIKLPNGLGYPSPLWHYIWSLKFPKHLKKYFSWADLVIVEEPHIVPIICEKTSLPVIYSSHNIESENQSWLINKPFGTVFYKYIKHIEQRAVKSADMIVCVSKDDKGKIRENFSIDDSCIYVLPNSVSRSAVKSTHIDESKGTGSSCLFVGSDYYPNIEAVENLIKISSKLRDDITVDVVGNVCNNFENTPDNINLLGFVDDIDQIYSNSSIAINPMSSGGGTNIKLLEFLAKGLPVITTPFGARGLDITHEKEGIITELSDFPRWIEYLIDSSQTRQNMSRLATKFIRDNHIWEDNSEDFQKKIVKEGLIQDISNS